MAWAEQNRKDREEQERKRQEENENQSSENEEYLPSKRFVTQAATISIILTAYALVLFKHGLIITAIKRDDK